MYLYKANLATKNVISLFLLIHHTSRSSLVLHAIRVQSLESSRYNEYHRIIYKNLQLTRANTLDPIDITTNGGQVLVAVLRDQNHILNSYAPDALILLQHVVVDMLRVAYGGEQVRREVNSRFNRLRPQAESAHIIYTYQM